MFALPFTFQSKAQPVKYTFKEPVVTINFGTGDISDPNTSTLYNYRRTKRDCPTDGHYSYTSYTSDCFHNDWVTIPEDHTPGDANGNMMIVNASPFNGTFLTTTITGLKGGTTYEFSVWMMNVCKPTDKCPFPLLPDITILLQRPDGKMVSDFGTGELVRRNEPQWTRHQVLFTTTPSETTLTLTMIDKSPGGCGNDFALDDISFRERVPIKSVIHNKPKAPTALKKQPPVLEKETPPTVKKQPQTSQLTKERDPQVIKKAKPQLPPIAKSVTPQRPLVSQVPKTNTEIPTDTVAALKPRPPVFPPPPPLVATRENPLIKRIETEPGEIRLDLYDNGIVDGDTISVYHNNQLLVGHARLTEKAITFRITIDAAHPHHEFIMVAHNLGSIPPNTSLMVVTTGTKRYEVFVSTTEEKNGKVIIDLKE